MKKTFKVRKLVFPGIIAGLILATIAFSASTFTLPTKYITKSAEAASSLTNSGYDSGEYQYYDGTYYDSIGDSAISSGGTTLLTALNNLIEPSKAYGYGNIWTAYNTTDKYPSDYNGTDPLTGNTYPTTNNSTKRGKIWDMYSDANYTYSTGQCGTYSNVGDCYNREHSMPKSWFSEGDSPSSKPGTDPHHLFATDGKVNGVRSNYPYGEVSSVTTNCYTLNSNVTGFGKLGTSSTSGIGTVFEPDDAYKGDLARAQMYMAVAYYDYSKGLAATSDAQKAFTYSNSVSTMKSYYITLLTKWSEEDPVSQKEIDRNNAVYTLQGNRNPFVDHPGWANKIWGGTEYTWGKTTDPTVSSVTVSPKSANLYLDGTKTVQLSATVNVSGGAAQTVSWTSSNTSVATVSSSGLVTAKAAGNATITVKSTVDTSKSDTCSITVSNSTPVSYTVTFNANGHGTAPSSQSIASGGLVTEPTAPTAPGYTFGGWYKEAECTNAWNFSTDTVTAATTLYAKWTENSSGGDATYEQLTLISDIDSNAQYVLGVDGTGFHYDGTSSWGLVALPTAQTPLYYTLTKNSGDTSFTAQTTISNTSYYLTVPSSKTFTMSTSSASLVLGTNGAILNTAQSYSLRYNSAGGLRAYSNTTGVAAYFYKVNTSSGGTDTHTVTISGDSSVTLGSTLTLTASCSQSDAITWTSSKLSVATVDNGVVTPVSVGTTTIAASCAGEGLAFKEITVVGAYVYPLVTGDLYADEEVYIAAKTGSTYYILGSDLVDTSYPQFLKSTIGTVSNNKLSSPTSTMTAWKVSKDGTQYIFSSNSTYLNSDSSGSKIYFSNSYSGYKWTFADNQLKSNSNVYLSHKLYNSTPEFCGASSASSYTIYIFRKVQQLDADGYAEYFNENITCDSSGSSSPTFARPWSYLNTLYDSMISTAEQNKLKNASYSVSGSGSSTVVTPDSGTTQVVANAISKYEVIVRKYSYTNFIGRSGLSGQAFFLTDSESTSMVVAIVITSLIAISTIGGFIFLKKKRENY